MKKVIFLGLFLSSLYSIDYRPYFVGVQYSQGLSSFYSSCGNKDSLGDGFGIKSGIREENYRIYTSYDKISWSDADISVLSLNADYIIPLLDSKKRVSLNMYKMLSIYFGINVSYIKFNALNQSDSQFNFMDPIELLALGKSVSNYGLQMGLIYDFDSDIAIEASYRYFPADLKVGSTRFLRMDNLHLLSFGANLKFGGEIKNFKPVEEVKTIKREIEPIKNIEATKRFIKPILPVPAPVVVAPIPKIIIPKRVISTKKCTNPPSCTVLDSNNCPLKIELKVLFDRDSYIFDKKYDEDLITVKEILEKNSSLKVIIQGFTDSRDTKSYNLTLSQNRANAIMSRLLELGVEKNRVIAHGYGENYPIASNDTKEGRAKNRRVEAEFYEDKFYKDGGCKLKDMILEVNFDRNSTYLKPKYDEEILKIAKVLKIRDDLKIKIEGHTDSKNSESYNQKLSHKRAQSVAQKLKDFGIDLKRVRTFGYGESKPIASNDTKDGREKNRRVEVKFIKE
jgi:OOP family OmpA-OmpF porin